MSGSAFRPGRTGLRVGVASTVQVRLVPSTAVTVYVCGLRKSRRVPEGGFTVAPAPTARDGARWRRSAFGSIGRTTLAEVSVTTAYAFCPLAMASTTEVE